MLTQNGKLLVITLTTRIDSTGLPVLKFWYEIKKARRPSHGYKNEKGEEALTHPNPKPARGDKILVKWLTLLIYIFPCLSFPPRNETTITVPHKITRKFSVVDAVYYAVLRT